MLLINATCFDLSWDRNMLHLLTRYCDVEYLKTMECILFDWILCDSAWYEQYKSYKTPMIVCAISGPGIKVCVQPHGSVCILSTPFITTKLKWRRVETSDWRVVTDSATSGNQYSASSAQHWTLDCWCDLTLATLVRLSHAFVCCCRGPPRFCYISQKYPEGTDIFFPPNFCRICLIFFNENCLYE